MGQQLQAGQQVNKVGKYLYKHIDGCYKLKFSPNTCEILMFMYYQIPGQGESLKQMNFEINITTYQNKLRVNLTELTDFEKTIGQVILKPDELEDLEAAKQKVYDKICYYVEREYSDYDFVY